MKSSNISVQTAIHLITFPGNKLEINCTAPL